MLVFFGSEERMKKITFLSFFLVLMISSSAQAFLWAYPFVAWDGKVYEVKEEELLHKSEIGKRIGKVKTQPYYFDDRTETKTYSGDASNIYPIGTPYYEIKGVSTSTAIAVKVGNKWIRADFIHVQETPQHKDPLTKLQNIAPFVIVGLILIGFFYRVKKIRRQKILK